MESNKSYKTKKEYSMNDNFELMKKLEGFKRKSYSDTKGLITVGIGFNMDTLYSKSIWDELDILEDFSLVYNEAVELCDESIEKLFSHIWSSSITSAKLRAKALGLEYDAMPDWHQFILADIAYNTGSVNGWTKVFRESSPEKVFFEARRKQTEIDSRVAKIGHHYGLIPTLEYAHEIGLTEAKYLV